MTNGEILKTAMRQSALDSGCEAEDFASGENKVVLSRPDPRARKYLELPFYCDLTSYGGNVVASVSGEFQDAARRYIDRYPVEHCFETPNMEALNQELRKRGHCVCFMAEYFLPDAAVRPLPTRYETKILEPRDFAACYTPQWRNALSEKRGHLDVLAAGAFDGEKLVGLAGCSADCDPMWQIGVDVLPAYRRQGVAAAVTSLLAHEILRRGIVPFYCCAWSNLPSVRNALRSGFKPGWVQITAKRVEFVEALNHPWREEMT